MQFTPKMGLPLAQISAGIFFRTDLNLKVSIMKIIMTIIFIGKRWLIRIRMRHRERLFCQRRRRDRVAAAHKAVAWAGLARTWPPAHPRPHHRGLPNEAAVTHAVFTGKEQGFTGYIGQRVRY